MRLAPCPSRIVALFLAVLLCGAHAAPAASSYVYQLPLRGNPAMPGQLVFTPVSHAFGSMPAGSSASTVTRLANTGQSPVTLSSLQVAAPFSHSSACPTVLAGGAACDVVVTFQPGAAGSFNANLRANASPALAVLPFAVSGSAVATTSDLLLSAQTLRFDAVAVGQPAPGKALTLTNRGTSPLTVSGIGFQSPTPDFAQSNNCGAPLAAGASCTVNLGFTPTQAGARLASLVLFESAKGLLHSVALEGTGNAPLLEATPGALALGSAVANAGTRTATLTLANNGTLPVSGLNFDPGATDFSVSGTTCTSTLAAGASCLVSVTFAPKATGTRSGTLLIHSANAGSASVALSGTGTAQTTSVKASVASLAFPNTAARDRSTAKTVVFTNDGNAPVSFSGMSLPSGSPNFEFSHTCGASLAVGSSCSAGVTFTPTLAGPHAGALRASFSSGPVDVTLSGTGLLADVEVSAASLAFPAQQVATSSLVKTVIVSNTGNQPVTFSGIDVATGTADFAQTNDCATLAVGGTCTVSVLFTPSAPGTRNGSLALVYGEQDEGIVLVTLSGSGQAAAVTLSPPAFASTAVGSSSTAVALLSNNGSGPVSVTAPTASSVTGTGFSFVSTTCGGALAAGANCAVTIQFTRAAAATTYGSVVVATSAGVKTAEFDSSEPRGYASVSTASLAFAKRQVGASEVKQVRLTNTGSLPLAVSGVSIPAGSFTQTNDCATVAAGAVCTVSVTFLPTSAGDKAGTLTFTHDGNGATTVNLTGSAVDPAATLSTPVIPGTDVGASNTAVATLKNTGIGALSVTVPGASSVTGTDFSFQATTCNGSLPAGAYCTVTVKFAPTAATPRSGVLTVTTQAGALKADLVATASQGNMALSASSLGFGTVQRGLTASKTLTVSNNGTGAVSVTGASFTTGAADYLLDNPCGDLAVGATCAMTVTFKPSLTGSRPGTLSVTHSAGGSISVALTGSGKAPAGTLSPVSFPATPVGSSSTAVATLKNTGIGPLSVASITSSAMTGSSFSFVSTSCGAQLAVGETCDITIRFSPTSSASATGTLSVSTGAGTLTAQLGTAGIPGYAHISPKALVFPRTQAGQTPVLPVTVTNTGAGTLNFTKIEVVSTYFTVDGGACVNVAPGATCTVPVTFKPTGTGVKSASLVFTHAAGSATVDLTGESMSPVVSFVAPDFPVTGVGYSSEATLVVRNDGYGPLDLPAPVMNVVNSVLTILDNQCLGTLGAGEACNVHMKFTPSSYGTYTRELTWAIVYTAAGNTYSPKATITPKGAQGELTTDGRLYLDAASVGGTVADAVVLTNIGDSPLRISSIAKRSGVGSNTAAFTVDASACLRTLAVNESCPLQVTAKPTVSGFHLVYLDIVHNGIGQAEASAQVSAYAPITVSNVKFSHTVISLGATNLEFSWYQPSQGKGELNCTGAVSRTATNTTSYGGLRYAIPTRSVGLGTCEVKVYNQAGDYQTYSATVEVVGAAQVTEASFSPAAVTAGNSSTFSWTTQDAVSATVACTGVARGSGSGVNGSITVTNTGAGIGTCTVTAKNSLNAAVTKSASLSVMGGPAVTSAAFSPSSVTAGGSATFSWATSNATSASVACSTGATAQGLSGSLTLAAPASGDATCTVTASNGVDAVTRSAVVTSVAAPTVTSAGFDAVNVSVGSGNVFTWATSGATSASVTCSGVATGSASGTSGSLTVASSTTPGTGTCTVTAANGLGQSATRSASFTTGSGPAVTSVTFAKANVTSGAGNTFSWTTSNATGAAVACSGSASGTGSGTSGSIAVATSGTGVGTCTVTASSALGSASGSETFNVVAAPAVTGAYFDPAGFEAGGGTTFHWTTAGASSASVTCGGVLANPARAGTSGSVWVAADTAGAGHCSVSAVNVAGATASASASLTVTTPPVPPAPVASLSATSVMLPLDGPTTNTYGPYRRIVYASQSDAEYTDSQYSHFGQYTGTATVTLTNTGGTTLVLGDVTTNAAGLVTDNYYRENSDYSFTEATAYGCPGTLGAGQSCVLTLYASYEQMWMNDNATNYSLKPVGLGISFYIATNAGTITILGTVQ